MNEGIELLIYRHSDPQTLVTTLAGRRRPKYLDELGVGAGGFLISTTDPEILNDPTLLDYRNIVKFSVNGLIVGAIQIQKKVSRILDPAGRREEVYDITGPGLLNWFADAQVAPQNGLSSTSYDDRYFNFAAKQGAWYNQANWPTTWTSGTMFSKDWWKDSNALKKWPDSGKNVTWVWNTPQPPYAPVGVAYFRHEFTTATEQDVVIYALGDNEMELFVDGAMVAKYSWAAEALRIKLTLPAGAHVIAMKCDNLHYAAGVALAMYKLSADGKETLWRYTKNNDAPETTWRVNAYPAQPPAQSPGEILLTLMAEAQARGVRFPTYVTPTFTALKDSDGVDWPAASKLEWSFKIGKTSLLDVLNQFREVGIHVWIDPITYQLHAALSRGTNRTVDPNAVTFEAGKNLRKAQSDGTGKVKNALAVKSAEGWLRIEDAASKATYGAIEDILEVDAPTPMAQKLALSVFGQKAQAEEAATYDVTASHEVPWVDYFPGDMVLAPNDKGLRVPRRVVSISLEENAAGLPQYNIEFDVILLSNDQLLSRAINKSPGSSGVGGSLAGTGGVRGPGSGPITTPGGGAGYIEKPQMPTGVTVVSEGDWDSLGAAPFSRATVTWAPVTLSTDNQEMAPSGYEVDMRDTLGAADAWDRMANVTGTTAIIQPLVIGRTYQFRVRAIGSAATSDWSAIASKVMVGPTVVLPAPSAPTLTTGRAILNIGWDGKLAGNDPPLRFRHVYAEVRNVTDNTAFARMGMALMRGGGSIPISGLIPGKTYQVRLTAVDGVGIESAKSTAVSIVVQGINLGSLESDVAAAIAAAKKVADDLETEFDDFYSTQFTDLDNLFNDFYDTDLPKIQQRMVIADGENLIADVVGELNTVAPHGIGNGAASLTPQSATVDANGLDAGRHLYAIAGGVADDTWRYLVDWAGANGNFKIPVQPDTEYSINVLVRAGGSYPNGLPQVQWVLREFDEAGTAITLTSVTESNTALTWNWQQCGFTLKTKKTTTHVQLHMRNNKAAAGTRFARPRMYRRFGGELLVDGTVAARHMQADSVYAQHVVIGSTQNLIANGMGEKRAALGWARDLTWDAAEKPDGMQGSFKSAKGQGTLITPIELWDVEPGSEYLLEIWLKADVPNSRLYLELRDQNNVHGTTNRVPPGYTYGEDSWASASYPFSSGLVPTDWTRFASIATTNPTVSKLQLGSIYFNHSNGTERNAQVWMLVRLRPRNGAELMVDGSILGRHVGANEIDTAQLRARSVVAETVALRELTGEHLKFRTLTGDEMELGTLKVEHVADTFGRDLVITENERIIFAVGEAGRALGVAEGVGTNLETMQTYYKFGNDGAEISKPDSPYSLVLKNDGIEIQVNQVPVSRWTSQQMHVNDFVGTTVTLGNHMLTQYPGGTIVRAL